jgi:hypothetical protein
MRRIDRNNISPILRDLSRGSGGLGTGYFTMSKTDNLPFDPTSNVWGTETGDPVVTETGTPIKLTSL